MAIHPLWLLRASGHFWSTMCLFSVHSLFASDPVEIHCVSQRLLLGLTQPQTVPTRTQVRLISL